MKKVYLLVIIYVFNISVVSANWYGNHAVYFDTNPKVQNCDDDNDGISDPVRVAYRNGGGSSPHGTDVYPGNNTMGTSGHIRCLYWDGQKPNIANASYDFGWKNDPVIITAKGRDVGGSRLKTMTLKESKNGSAFSVVKNWNPNGANNQTVTRSWTRSAVHGHTYRYQILVKDNVGKELSSTSTRVIKFDLNRPTTNIRYTKEDGTEYTPGEWSDQKVKVSITCSDDLSLCDMYAQSGWDISGNTYSRTYSTDSTGINSSLIVRDHAGNEATRNFGTIKIDTTTPGVPVITANDRGNNQWSNDNTTFLAPSLDTSGQVSPRRNYFCRDYSASNQSIASPCDPNNPNQSSAWDTTGLADGTYYYRVKTCTSTTPKTCSQTRTFIVKIDTTPPNASDISNTSPGDGADLLANHQQNISLTVSENGGSPINQIRAYFENDATINSYITTPYTSTNGTLSHYYDIRNVDRNRVDGARQYSLKVSKICDAAGNCTTLGNNSTSANGIKNYTYNVYANTNKMIGGLSKKEVFSEELSLIGNVADGTEKKVKIRLKDTYGNAIVPASSINRRIGFNININNQLRLDQYNNNDSNSAWFVKDNNAALLIGDNKTYSLDNMEPINNGEYNIPFYIYAPTNNTDEKVPGSAKIKEIKFTVTGGLGSLINNSEIDNSNIAVKVKPLYKTEITGQIKDNGFREGAAQDVSIGVTKVNTTSTTGNSLRAEFGDVQLGVNEDNGRYDFIVNSNSISELPNNPTYLGSLNTMTGSTLMAQNGSVDGETFSYFATIVEYEIDGKTIIYPSDIIGKGSYHGTQEGNNSYQSGVKITGNTSSQNTGEITTDQFSKDVRVLGVLTKSTFRRDIEKKVYSVIRNIKDSDLNNGGGIVNSYGGQISNRDIWTNTDGKKVFGDSVLFFRGEDITLRGGTIMGNKTLIVENGDVYVSGDITGEGILGIIVLNGDILIKTSVTDIHAILYTNRSVLSSTNGIDRINGTASADTLKNQLYIKGALFSENTIGGSRGELQCPYYINTTCDRVTAQAYDLNYLRRYYRFGPDSDGDGIPDSKSGEQSYGGTSIRGGNGNIDNFPVIIDYNPEIQQTPPPFFD